MKHYLLYLLLAVAFLASCGEREKKKDAQAYMNEIAHLVQERHTDPAAVDAALNATLHEGLAAYPDNIYLLTFRTDFDCRRGMLQECRADALRLLELTKALEVRMMLCMLDEVEGADRREYEACYREIAEALAARPLPPARSEQWDYGSKVEYVFTLLLARHPDAEKEKAALLAAMASEQEGAQLYDIYENLLENFDRERVLRGMFGQE